MYSYDDAFKFSRIVMSDDLIFDSHFESGNLLKASRVNRSVTEDSAWAPLFVRFIAGLVFTPPLRGSSHH